jgi:hypothetical protein
MACRRPVSPNERRAGADDRDHDPTPVLVSILRAGRSY